jgi:hypothetical protein
MAKRPPPPTHTHLQVLFTNNNTLFFPISATDAEMAVGMWLRGSPVVTLRPSDGSAFHVNVGSILFLRQVTEDVAVAMVQEQNELNARRAADAQAQLAEQEATRRHNAEVRAVQMSGLKSQLARGGVIAG